MIKYVKGDILLSSAETVAHGVAPNDNFKKGLAHSLKEQWPSMYKDFRHFCKTTHPKEGSLWSWRAAGSPLIINLFTQGHPRSQSSNPEPADISYVNRTLKALVKEVANQDVKSLAITKLATGVGGLKWNDVKPLIENHLGDIDIPIYVYEEYHKDQKATEV